MGSVGTVRAGLPSAMKVAGPAKGNGKRALVTGGAGFLGSHLCERLLKDGYCVVSLDNFRTGRRSNFKSIRGNPRFVSMEHDVVHAIDIDLRFDQVYNLACPASPPHYQADPIGTLRTNVLGAMNALEVARRHGSRIFQASTSEIYGDPQVHPQKESYFGNVNAFGPRSCYDEGKRCAETLFFEYSHMHGVDIRVARIFNTYGPRMQPDDGRVVSNFIVQALNNKDITVYGDGSQTRSFCYVDDLIEGFIRLMSLGEAPAGPVNLGNPQEFTVLEFAKLVIACTGSRSKIVHRGLPVDDPKQRRPDISLAKAVLGWQPSVPVVEGLVKTITYFDQLLRAKHAVMHGAL